MVGVVALLGRAIVSLAPLAWEAIRSGLSPILWAILLLWVVFMAWSEGYRGFQLRFAPFVAARALVLRRGPTWVQLLLAPAFLMGLFHARPRRLFISWAVLIGVSALVVGMRWVSQPWRGIIDAGVVAGLGWGTLAVLFSVARAWSTGHSPADPALPSETP
jgi:hypothetical protein